MTIDMSQFYQVFFEEASEHLATMEGLLLELDVELPDLETLNAIFRAAHSIKGGAGTFGFEDMAEVTHVLETLLDRLRKQEMDPTVEMIDAFLQAGDLLKAQLAAHQEGVELEDPRVAQVCERLETLARLELAGGRSAAPQATPGYGDERTWRIELPREALDGAAGTGIQGLLEAMADLGALEDLTENRDERHIWRLTTRFGREAIVETFAFVCDPDRIRIEALEADGDDAGTSVPDLRAGAADEEAGFGLFEGAPGGEGLAEPRDEGFGLFEGSPGMDRIAEVGERERTEQAQGYGFFAGARGSGAALDQDQEGYGLFGGSPGMTQVGEIAERARSEQEDGFGFFDDSPGAPHRAGLDSAKSADARAAGRTLPEPPAGAARSVPAKRPATADSSIRVSVEKVDQLINLVGELVITHAMLAESASSLDPVMHERIFGGLSNLERNSRDLQQAVMSIRMMPISFVFNRFPRVVRDTAATLGKKVSLKLVGEDTELDKGLIERLADPLNHLVRNSIDHGIELPERRLAAGKPESGEIVLRASHRGGSVLVEVIDNGGGLDREKLLAKAAKQGIPMPENPTDKEIWQLIFHAGFSTAERVTDISGRGVGMDVVRRNIEEMNGRVDIDSEPGAGTHITIRLPLTLAILDGLSVRMGEEIFILPLTAIQESIQPAKEQFKTIAGKGQVFQVNGEYLPLVVLHHVFRVEPPQARLDDGILVIVDTNEGRAAVLVDELVAQHQVVIKSLETNYRKVEGASGATIMGDGRVALILDVDALVRLSRKAA